MQTVLGTRLTRRDVFRAAWRIRREDRIAMGPALRRAWLWVRRKAETAQRCAAEPARRPAPRHRTVDDFNPRLVSTPRRFEGRGCGSWSFGA